MANSKSNPQISRGLSRPLGGAVRHFLPEYQVPNSSLQAACSSCAEPHQGADRDDLVLLFSANKAKIFRNAENN